MAETVRELIPQRWSTDDADCIALPEASDRELAMLIVARGALEKQMDADHQRHRSRKIHTGQVLEGRYESRNTASPRNACWPRSVNGRGS